MPGGWGNLDGRVLTISCIFMLALPGLMIPPGTNMAPSVAADVVEEPFEDPFGLMWADPVRVTDNPRDDRFPSIRVDDDGHANMVYQQSGAEYVWAEVGPPSEVLFTDHRLLTGYIPTQYQVKNESTPQPTEFFDIGPDGGIHVVWTEAGLLDNRYRSFDDRGEATGPVIPMNQITDLSRLPYLVVGKNGRAYIAFENEGTAWVQMTYVDEEGYIRAPALIGRPGENVAFTGGPDGTMHLFYRSLGADVSMYHVKLDRDRRPIVPNDVIFPSSSEVANPFSSMPTMTVTPDGHVHLLISDTTIAPHPIHYVELDENGTRVLNSMKIVEGAHNYGDVVASPDNDVYVFWDDVDDGEIHYTRIRNGTRGEEVVVTSTGGKARYPQVDSGTVRGDLHLSYVDERDGDGEIYYRYANAFRIVLGADDLDRVREVHPGDGEVELEITVSNLAEVANEVRMEARVDYHGLEGGGWNFGLDRDGEVLEMAPGEVIGLRGRLTVPATGKEGEQIDVSISAVPERSVRKSAHLDLTSRMVITRAISIMGPSRVALDQENVSVPIQIRNDGDLEERLTLEVEDVPPDWRIRLGHENLTLEARGGTMVTDLTIEVPSWTEEGTVVPLALRAIPASGNSNGDLLDMILVVRPTVFPVLEDIGDTILLTPGEWMEVNLSVGNQGSNTARMLLSTVVRRGVGEWDLALEQTEVTVGAGATVEVEIGIRVARATRAGSELELEIDLREMEGDFHDRGVLRAEVGNRGGIRVEGGGVAGVLPEETAEFPVRIVNRANSASELTLSVHSLPGGWKWRYGGEDRIFLVHLEPHADLTTVLLVTPPRDCPSGEIVVRGVVEDGGEEHFFNATVNVEPVHGVRVEARVPIAKTALGSEARFVLDITNPGTVEQTYELVARGMGVDVPHRFERQGGTVKEVRVAPNMTEEVTLYVQAPNWSKEEGLELWAGARAETAALSSVDLIVEFRLPDIRIRDVIFNYKGIEAGDRRDIEVLLQNTGDGDARDVEVVVNGKVVDVDLDAGEEGSVATELEFDGDEERLVVVVDPHNDHRERSEANNAYFQELEMEGDGGSMDIPGYGAITLMMASCLALYGVLRRRGGNGPRRNR